MTQRATQARLVADLGGTNVRFAVQREPDAPLTDFAAYACVDHAGLLQAIRFYLDTARVSKVRQAAIGVAAPIKGDRVSLINNRAWDFSIAELKASLQVDKLDVLNDFAALAHCVPALKADDVQPVAASPSQAAIPNATRIVVGPGTGLGLAAMATDRHGRHQVIGGEGGHGTLPAADAQEAELLRVLRAEYGHVSAERVISGPGMANLYRAHCVLKAIQPEPLDAEMIVKRALAGGDLACKEVVEQFVRFLGSFAGSQALAFGALGGVYLSGGVLSHLRALFDEQLFRRQFEAKGRYEAYLKAIPVYRITLPHAALTGALMALA